MWRTKSDVLLATFFVITFNARKCVESVTILVISPPPINGQYTVGASVTCSAGDSQPSPLITWSDQVSGGSASPVSVPGSALGSSRLTFDGSWAVNRLHSLTCTAVDPDDPTLPSVQVCVNFTLMSRPPSNAGVFTTSAFTRIPYGRPGAGV
jgi:hypothetical protein